MKDFIKLAMRTEQVRDDIDDKLQSVDLADTCSLVCEDLTVLDTIKKNLFYKGTFNAYSDLQLPTAMHQRALHAALGVITEGAELLEAVVKAAENGEGIDLVNWREELADVLWYVAIGADVAEVDSLSSLEELVIAKLRKRYPEKFTEEAACNRDVVGERQVLEQLGK